MNSAAAPAMRHLVFVCGHAGAGKTTLARRLVLALAARSGAPFCILDKDAIYGDYSAGVLEKMGRDPDDRDSAFFLDTFRDLEYRCLVGAARDNLAAGVGAVVVAPLSKEVKGGLLHDREWLGLKPGDAVSVSVIWMRVDEAEARRRMAERADPRDAYKLANWELYAPRRPELVAAHPRTLVLDTTGGHGAVDVDAVVDFVLGSSAGARM